MLMIAWHHEETKPRGNRYGLLILGPDQVIASWVGHINALAKDRRLIVIEARGQGEQRIGHSEQSQLGSLHWTEGVGF